VLNKLRRPLLAAHRRQINREPSPDRLVFQIARTTISPNYLGKMFEISDREVLMVSARRMSSMFSEKMLTPRELRVVSKK
jgi:hypothetical protein